MTTSAREDEIRQDIERTREQLGDTGEALAHQVDVPARVKDTVHVRAKEVTQQAHATTEKVTQQVREGTEALQAPARKVTRHAEHLIDPALDTLPPPVAARLDALMAPAKQRPLPAVGVGVLLVLRRLLHSNR